MNISISPERVRAAGPGQEIGSGKHFPAGRDANLGSERDAKDGLFVIQVAARPECHWSERGGLIKSVFSSAFSQWEREIEWSWQG